MHVGKTLQGWLVGEHLVGAVFQFGDVVAVFIFCLNSGFAVPAGAHGGQLQGQAIGQQLKGSAGAIARNQIVQVGVGKGGAPV